jgi:integral membrane protein
VLQLVYLVALIVTARVHDWGVLRQLLGFVASLLPFGTFVFERRVR